MLNRLTQVPLEMQILGQGPIQGASGEVTVGVCPPYSALWRTHSWALSPEHHCRLLFIKCRKERFKVQVTLRAWKGNTAE